LEILTGKGRKSGTFFLEHLFEGLPRLPGRPLEHLFDRLAALPDTPDTPSPCLAGGP
jgi:hypothetical protein